MPATPQIASFHVIGVGAERVRDDVRLVLRTKEAEPFALIFPPVHAEHIGLRIVTVVNPPEVKTQRYRNHTPAMVEKYEQANAFIEQLGVMVNIAAVLREKFPEIPYTLFMNWRNRELYRQRKAAARARTAEGSCTQ